MRIFGGWRRCPGCGRRIARLDDDGGDKVCPKCGSVIFPAPLEEPRDDYEAEYANTIAGQMKQVNDAFQALTDVMANYRRRIR